MSESAPPPQIAGFRLLGVLGHGAAGTVYLAEQESLERQVALKVLHPQFDLPSFQSRFRREAQLLGEVQHPSIIRFLGYGKSPQPYLVMEYLAGGTLKDRIQQSRANPRPGIGADLTLVLARELLSALETLHQAGLVHRDLKPGNILFHESGEAVIGDLGLAGHISADATRLTGAGDLLGTLPYMAPELMKGKDHSVASDLFSMGVTLHEAVTGAHPTNYGPFPPGFRPENPSQINPDCPRILSELIRSLMAPDPAHRPRSAASALASLLQRPTASIQTTVRIPRWRRTTLVAGVTLAALALALGLTGLASRTRAPALPPLAVTVRSRGAEVRMKEAAPGTFLVLFDDRGRALRGVDGTLAGGTGGSDEPGASVGSMTFQVEGLTPGTTYTACSYRRDAGTGGSPRPGVTFRIPPVIAVHGLEAGRGEPAVWISSEPRAWASWVGGGARRVTRSEPVRIPLESGEKGALERLRLELEGWGVIFLTFPGMAALAKEPDGTRLGIRLDRKAIMGIDDGKGRHTIDRWLKRSGVRMISIRSDGNGRPWALDGGSAPLLPGVEVFHEFAPGGDPTDITWAVAAGKEGRRLVVDPDWFAGAIEASRADPTLRESTMASVQRWREWSRRQMGGTRIVAPLPGWLSNDPKELLGLITSLGNCDALGTLIWAEIPVQWEEWARGLQRVARDKFSLADLRWLWVVEGQVNEVVKLDPFFVGRSTSSTPARSFLLSRIHAPKALCVIDLTTLRDPATGKLGSSWTGLAALAKSLSQVTYQRPVGTHPGELPRLETAGGVATAIFAGDGRRVIVLTSRGHDQPLASFFPARPGILRTPTGKEEDPYEDRPVLSPGAIEGKIDSWPMIYEELVKITVEMSDESVVSLETPSWESTR